MMAHTRFLKAMAYASALALLVTPAFAVADFALRQELDTRSAVTCSAETAFGDFVADALKKVHGADVGLVPCAVIKGNRTYAKGDTFDAAAVAAEITTDAKVVQIDATGMQLLEALELALSMAPTASDLFPQVSGLRMEVDMKKPLGQRIVKLTSNGAAIDFGRSYRIATTEDALKVYPSLAQAKRVNGQSVAVTETVSAHLQAVGVAYIKNLGRIKVRP